MRPRISIRGFVRPSVSPSVRNHFFKRANLDEKSLIIIPDPSSSSSSSSSISWARGRGGGGGGGGGGGRGGRIVVSPELVRMCLIWEERGEGGMVRPKLGSMQLLVSTKTTPNHSACLHSTQCKQNGGESRKFHFST